MKTILLYGQLGQRFGRVHRYEVKSPAEAVRAMCCTMKGFKQAVLETEYYRVLVGGKDQVEEDGLANPVSDRETIRIVPLVSGASGFGKVVLGAALISVGVFGPAIVSGAYGAGIISTAGQGAALLTATSFAGNIGIALALGGISKMLFAPDQASGETERPENRPSYMFNGPVNTIRQGGCVPVAYGRVRAGSQVISQGLSVDQI